MRPLRVSFAAGDRGPWAIEAMVTVSGPPLGPAERLDVIEGDAEISFEVPPAWVLRGVTSNERYVTGAEQRELVARQEGIGRESSTRAALLPITKSDAWWELPQDERRRIFEESSHHLAIGLDYLPAIARRLHHGRDLGEPFDFLTWFEYAPGDASAFEQLVGRLRGTEEWSYIEREIDIRLRRERE